MTQLHRTAAGRRAHAALRLLAVGGLAAMLGGCYESKVAQTAAYPTD